MKCATWALFWILGSTLVILKGAGQKESAENCTNHPIADATWARAFTLLGSHVYSCLIMLVTGRKQVWIYVAEALPEAKCQAIVVVFQFLFCLGGWGCLDRLRVLVWIFRSYRAPEPIPTNKPRDPRAR